MGCAIPQGWSWVSAMSQRGLHPMPSVPVLLGLLPYGIAAVGFLLRVFILQESTLPAAHEYIAVVFLAVVIEHNKDGMTASYSETRSACCSPLAPLLMVALTGGGLRDQMRLYPRVGVMATGRPRPSLLLLPLLLVLLLLLFAEEPSCSIVAWRREI